MRSNELRPTDSVLYASTLLIVEAVLKDVETLLLRCATMTCKTCYTV